jgi:hypothetical protein
VKHSTNLSAILKQFVGSLQRWSVAGRNSAGKIAGGPSPMAASSKWLPGRCPRGLPGAGSPDAGGHGLVLCWVWVPLVSLETHCEVLRIGSIT